MILSQVRIGARQAKNAALYAADQSSSFFKVLKIILTERNYPDKLYNLTLEELKDSNHLAMKYSFQFLSGNA